MSEHEHGWYVRGDNDDPWLECWTCDEQRETYPSNPATRDLPETSED